MVDDIVQEMWERWMLIAAGGAANVLLGGSVAEISSVPDGSRTVAALLAEAAAVVAACGHRARRGAIERAASTILTPGAPIAFGSSTMAPASSSFTTSLDRDFRTGARTEAEAIVGDLARLARENGVPAPLLDAAAVRLRVHQSALRP